MLVLVVVGVVVELMVNFGGGEIGEVDVEGEVGFGGLKVGGDEAGGIVGDHENYWTLAGGD